MKAAEVVDNILKHHGIKGQKWGIRRKATVGGGVQPHSDAVRARTTATALKSHGTHAVSTSDLKQYADRVRTEQHVRQLQAEQKNQGAKFVSRTLTRVGNRTIDKTIDKGLEAGWKKAFAT